jgi:hypothetical protein
MPSSVGVHASWVVGNLTCGKGACKETKQGKYAVLMAAVLMAAGGVAMVAMVAAVVVAMARTLWDQSHQRCRHQ